MGSKAEQSASAEFFGRIAARGHEPLLERVKGTVCVDLSDKGQRDTWYVTIDEGDVAVSEKNGAADLTIRTERAVFDEIATGEANGVAAFLRGEIAVSGEWEMLVLFQRLFPPPSERSGRKT